MAGKLLAVWKKNNSELKSDEMLKSLHNYFYQCKNIPDDWHKNKMNLAHIVTQFNTINAILKSGPKKKGQLQQDLMGMDYEQKPSDV